MNKPPFDLSVTDKLLTTTRAVRRRLDVSRPVGREVLLECVRIAQQAPTGGNSQSWRFVIVRDAEKRRRIADLYRDAGAERLRHARDAATDPQTRRVYESAVFLTDILADVPVHVIPCIQAAAPGNDPAGAGAYYGNILPATWNFMLALRSRGLGSVWTTQTLARETELARLLELPDGVAHVALIPVAYYSGADFSPAARPAPQTITSWDRWSDDGPAGSVAS